MYEQPPGYGGYQPPPPHRSAIPKVIGILMIILGSLGILGSLINFAGGIGNDELIRRIPDLGTYRMIEKVTTGIGLLMAIAQLVVGIKCVGYKTSAPGLAKVYAIVALVVTLGNTVISVAVLAPMLTKALEASGMRGMGGFMGGVTFFFSLIAVAWQVVILVLMSRPAAKDACTNV